MRSYIPARAWSAVEWKLDDGRGRLPIAYLDLDGGCVDWRGRRHLTGAQVGHRDRPPDAWTHRAAGDNSHFAACPEDTVSLACDAAGIVGFNADETLAGSLVVLRAKRGLSHERPAEPDESFQTRFCR